MSLDPLDMQRANFQRVDLESIGLNPRARDVMENLPLNQDAIQIAINETRTELNEVEGASFVVWQATTDKLTDARVVADSANITITPDATNISADLTDTGVDAAVYGSQTRILIQTIDAKGRIVDAQEVKMDVSDVDGTLLATHGGTGLSVYAKGDLLYAASTTTLARLADVATGNVLRSGGVGSAPSYGKVDLTTDVSGTLPLANGGAGGFTGSGAYTNFVIQNGLIVSAT